MIEKVIYIGGVARSGTSWIGQIFNSCPIVRFRFQPLFSYEFRGRVNEDSSSDSFQRFFSELYQSESEFLTQRDKVLKGLYPNFDKTHETVLVFKENRFQSIVEPMLRKCENLHFIGVIRNPNATLSSWTKNSKEFPEGSNIQKEWRFGMCKNKGTEDYFGYYKWKEVANLYLDLENKYEKRVTILHYDKFVIDPMRETEKLFKILQIPITDQTIDFLNKSKEGKDDSYYSVYKGAKKSNSWIDDFPSNITSEILADLKNTRLERFLY